MSIGSKLVQLRTEKQITQTELGKILGVGKTTISNYETGYSTPDAEMLKKIATYFNVSTDYILGLTDDLINTENTENPDKIDLGRMILNYVINKEQFDPNSDSYENLAELIAKIVANNEELLLKALDTTKQQEKKK